jgi:hypothetical protein
MAMGSKTIFLNLDTDKSMDEVKTATQKALMMMGGTIQNRGDGFQHLQAKNGINFSFAADFDTFVSIREIKPGKYELLLNANWKPNVLFWVCLIAGFFLGLPWIINILYLFIDPTSAYQNSLYHVNNLLS